MDGRAWIEAPPPELDAQRWLLLRLLAAIEPDERFRALELQCSVARGAGDELSDLDTGLWVGDDAWGEALGALPDLLRGLGSTVERASLPDEATLAAPDPTDLRRAAVAVAEVLQDYEPPPLARFVRARLE